MTASSASPPPEPPTEPSRAPAEPSGRRATESDRDLSGSPQSGVNASRLNYDEDWLVEAARSDRQAFGVLYDRHFDAIYHYVARRVGDAATAEDIASHVWERALVAIERYEVRGVPFAAWLYRIAGNLVANHHRRRRLWRMVPFGPHHAASQPHGRIDEYTALRAGLEKLSSSDQEILSLCYDAGLTPPEIADVLNCTPAAIHKRLHRARARLRQHLEGTRVPAASA